MNNSLNSRLHNFEKLFLMYWKFTDIYPSSYDVSTSTLLSVFSFPHFPTVKGISDRHLSTLCTPIY